MEDDARAAPPAPNAGPAAGAPGPGELTLRLRAPTPRVAVVIAAAIVAGLLLFAAGSAIRPFVVGLLLAYLLDPLVERFARRGLPRGLSVLLVFAISIGVVALGLAIAIPPLVRQIAVFTDELPAIIKAIEYQLDHLNELYDQLGLPQELRTFADSMVAAGLDAVHHLDISFLRPLVDSAASFVTSIFGYLILPAWLFFLLKDRPKLQAGLDRALPSAWRPDTWAIVGIIHEVFGKWVRGQLVLGGVVALASFVGLTILGFVVDPIFGRFAVLLAIIAGLGELIPIIGPIISAVPAVLLGLTAGPAAALAALILYLIIQLVENNFLVPKIQSDAIDLHPSAIIAALVIGGSIFGLLGAILALPVTAAFRDVFKYIFRRASELSGASQDDGPSSRTEIAAMEAAGGRFAAEVGAESVR
jgi:predicted PurR-regulated permease PerM